MSHGVAGGRVDAAVTSGEDGSGGDEGAAASVAAEDLDGDLLGELALSGVFATDNALVGQAGRAVPRGQSCNNIKNRIAHWDSSSTIFFFYNSTYVLKISEKHKFGIVSMVFFYTCSCDNAEGEDGKTHDYLYVYLVPTQICHSTQSCLPELKDLALAILNLYRWKHTHDSGNVPLITLWWY